MDVSQERDISKIQEMIRKDGLRIFPIMLKVMVEKKNI
jgi:hypothetical protein